jgi:Xaa-Pro dipeptidase
LILTNELFHSHLKLLQRNYESALEYYSELRISGLLLHSGSEEYYFSDDRSIPFNAYGHYMHWVPINRPDQFVLVIPGEAPKYLQLVPPDYWYEQSIICEHWLENNIEIIPISTIADLENYLKGRKIGYLGPNAKLANLLGIADSAINPENLILYLNFKRAYKTEYEIMQLRQANKMAILGHQAARDCFLNHGNEYDIHMAYLQACTILENDSPYTNIVALDEKCAILHYQIKRKGDGRNHKVLLIDAGFRENGYGSDITRTSIKDNVVKEFKELVEGVGNIERELVEMVKPGILYPEIHRAAQERIGQLLLDLTICSGPLDQLICEKVPQLFMPHGVGHLLGLQVHDVGGFQQDTIGTSLMPPEDSPSLRNTRLISKDMVFTIEPGLYFIPLLLEPERNTTRGKLINWQLINELYPYGGARIEDNVLVTANGAENLTRQFE